MWANAKIGKMFGIFCISTTIGSAVFHSIKYVRTLTSLETQNTSALRPLYMEAYFPFETHYTPMYEIICLCQVVGVLAVCISFSSFDGFFACSVLHFSSQLFNLRKRIVKLIEEHNTKKATFTTTIKSVVHEHQHIIG